MSSIPTIRGLPFLGSLREFQANRIGLLERVAHECGEIGSFRLGPRRVIVITSAELARVVLVDQAYAFEKGPVVRQYARPLFGDGLVSCENAVHRGRRRLLAPAFQPRQLSAHTETIVRAARLTEAAWNHGGLVDIDQEMVRLTLRVAGLVLFSMDLVDEAKELSEAMTIAIHHVTDKIQTPISAPAWLPTAKNRRFRDAVERLDRTIFQLIADRRAGRVVSHDLLGALVSARDPEDGTTLGDRQIRDELMTLFVAGHETTASTLAWTVYLLLSHPEVYRRVEAEVDRVVGARDPTYEDLPSLSYMLQVLKEVLRLYPSIHSLGRELNKPLDVGGYALEAGAIVIICPYLMHRRPDVFPDPMTFDPDRFTAEAEAAIPRHAYLPFGAGPRVCLGAHFAFMEAQLVLAALMQKVVFETAGHTRVEPEMLVTLRPRQAIRVKVQRREARM
jgi:cytochrome P450